MPELREPQAEPMHQRLRAWRASRLLVDTCRAHLYLPNARHPRWAVARDLLVQIPAAFTYDGHPVLSDEDADIWGEEDHQTTYFQVRNSDVRLWSYRYPDPEVAAVAGHLAAAGEDPGVHITVDGTSEACP